jgi:hypothetical protein
MGIVESLDKPHVNQIQPWNKVKSTIEEGYVKVVEDCLAKYNKNNVLQKHSHKARRHHYFASTTTLNNKFNNIMMESLWR